MQLGYLYIPTSVIFLFIDIPLFKRALSFKRATSIVKAS
jgi:hypothetical protein